MSTSIFVNLPVKDLEASIEFFTQVGYSFDKDFTDADATCMVIAEGIYAMLLAEPFFKTLTRKAVADATETTETIVAVGVDSRERVDELVDAALAAGGRVANDTNDQGFLYGRSFTDLDGHIWEVVYLDTGALRH